MHEKKFTIDLPKLPHGWSQLSAKEVETVNRLIRQKQERKQQSDPVVVEASFKLQCFLLFTKLKVRKHTEITRDGEVVYLFRRRGLRYMFENIPMRSWQIQQWIDSYLKWLDDPMMLQTCPYGIIRIGWRRFKAPSALMTDVTRIQYFTAQNIISQYWTSIKVCENLIKKHASRKAVQYQLKQINDYRCKFLACLFTPQSTEVEVHTDTSVRRVHRKVFVYEQSQIERNAKCFRRCVGRIFPVMLQFFQSVQTYYGRIFPELFTTHKDGNGTDYLQMEVDTMNALMKYQGLHSYREINDSNVVFILGVLNNMSEEAKQLKRLNAK